MKPEFDIVGIGLGPFNLSLAALLSRHSQVRSKFFEQKPAFSWHSEIMFADSVMQTSYLKDLVTPMDPTNPHSFLNYLVQHGLFFAHMNTARGQVSRREFEQYCQWVSKNLGDQVAFNSGISEIHFDNGMFHLKANGQQTTAKHLCVATGSTPWVPEFAQAHLSETCLHAKSPALAKADFNKKRVAIVGGGQTGLEVFRNAYLGKWGQPESVTLVSRRQNLEPLDESPFTNEYFTPNYVRDFFPISHERKTQIVDHQRLASDGNTPFYLQEIYNELYQLKHVSGQQHNIRILPQRQVQTFEKSSEGHVLHMQNNFTNQDEVLQADIVIFCTGFRTTPPACLQPLMERIRFDELGRFKLNAQFAIDWEHGASNKIYALNFGRHTHGISEPQTSLMAWRSGTVINDLVDENLYPTTTSVANFVQHGPYHER